MKFNRKALRRFGVVATATAMLVVGMASPADAALTNIAATPSNPVQGQANTITMSATSFSVANVGCVQFTLTGQSAVTTSSMTVAGPSWSTPTTGTGVVALDGTLDTVTGATVSVTNPTTVGSVTVKMEFFGAGADTNGVCSGTKIEGYSAAYSVVDTVTVSVSVDAFFTFGVEAYTGSCAGVAKSTNATSSATAVNLGPVGTVNAVSGSQKYTIDTNAANGWAINLKSLAADAPVMKGKSSSTHTFPDAASNATSATGPWFGYMASAKTADMVYPITTSFAQVTTGSVNVVTGDNACIGYAAKAGAATVADNYETQIVYQAVPTF